MPARCCVTGCNSVRKKSVPGLKFFKFPNDETSVERKQLSLERQAAWIKAISRNDVTPLNVLNKTVCAKHFKTGTPAHFKDKANPDWVPNIRMGHKKIASSTIEFEKPQATKLPDPLRQEEIMQEDEYVEIFEDEEKTQTTTAHRLIGQDALETIKLHQPNTNDSATMRQYQIEIEKLKNDIANLKKLIEEKNVLIAAADAELSEIAETQQSEVEEIDRIIKKLELLENTKSLTIEAFRNDFQKMSYFTGLPSFAELEMIFNLVKGDLKSAPTKGINVFDALIMLFKKLRLDLPYTYMSYEFGTSASTIARVFYGNLRTMSDKMEQFIKWPKKENLEGSAHGITAIIDFIENPGLAITRDHSTNKTFKPTKYLIAISPAKTIIFVSKAYDSNLSVKSIVESCGLLDKTVDGDIILSDGGSICHTVVVYNETKMLIQTVQNMLTELVAVQNTQTPSIENSLESRTIAIGNDAAEVINTLRKKYSILTKKMKVTVGNSYNKDNDGHCYFDDVVKVCCALVNVSSTQVTNECL